LAPGYVDLAPTLARILRESATITVAEVVRFSPERGAVVLKKVRDLKGQSSDEPLRHLLIRANESTIDLPLLVLAEPGRQCVVFATGKAAVVCVGEGWYQAYRDEDGWWRIGAARPDLPLAYFGSISRLITALPIILAGKAATLTTVPHGADREGASFDLALNRASLPGLIKVQRVRGSLAMPDVAMGIGANAAYVLGQGRVAPEELPALRKSLQAAEAGTRAESAFDLGFLGEEGRPAAEDLKKLLDDPERAVRLAAASALLRIEPKADEKTLDALAAGLSNSDAVVRRQAARAAGLAGAAGAPLAAKLGALLKDDDPLVRRLALQAIATLGPAARTAVEPVTRLLEQKETAVEAADALGRMGPSARSALKSLAKLLDSEAPAERWAAVRAMSQIGGDDAAPAVQFMIRHLPTAPEADGYNMLIYLSLLGPVAKEALPAIRICRVRNPILRQTTTWAIQPTGELPGSGMFGQAEFAQYIMEAYVHELGDHLKPAAETLARKILAGQAGNVPPWGYKLLARFPQESLAILTPALADTQQRQRERGAVALGYMGRAAAPARPLVQQAIDASQDERERRLLQWCLREISP
jgi:HEAT repeat protein